jgi:hypothetical protein
METEASINKRAARVQSALDGAFGVRAKTLNAALRKTGRRMPKLLCQVDAKALRQAEEAVVTWLDTIDRADQRKGFWIGIGAMIGFNILLAIGGVVVWMWWTGQV